MITIQDILKSLDPETLLALADDSSQIQCEELPLIIDGQAYEPQLLADTFLSVVDQSIENAVHEITSYTDSTNGFIHKLCVDIAIYNLFSRGQQEVPKIRQTRYANAIDCLIKISTGEITTNIQGTNSVLYSAIPRSFTRDTMGTF